MSGRRAFLALAELLRPHFTDFALPPPAGPGDLEAVRRATGLDLPADLAEVLATANGEGPTADPMGYLGLFLGYEFLGTAGIIEVYARWAAVRASGMQGYDASLRSYP